MIYVGRLVPEKGLLDLLNVFEEGRVENLELVVAGSGPLASAITDAARRFPITNLGFVQRSQLPRVLADADALVFPTHGDPHGLVVEEAIAAGLPVIASDAAGDITDRVSTPGVGVVYEAGSSRALADALTTFSDQSLRQAFAARTTSLRHKIDHERYAQQFEEMIFDVVD